MRREKCPTGLYDIIRSYKDNFEQVTIMEGVTEEFAIAHSESPDCKSSTCTDAEAIAATKLRGEWFDGYAWQYK